MPYFKDTSNKVHFLDDAALAALLPAGAVQITKAEADDLLRPPPETDEQFNAKVLAEGAAKERTELLPRAVREFLLEQPGAATKGWYAKVKQLDDDIVALKATLKA
jgi:hypothetical protein